MDEVTGTIQKKAVKMMSRNKSVKQNQGKFPLKNRFKKSIGKMFREIYGEM